MRPLPLERLALLLLSTVAVIATIHATATATGWYYTHPWIDIPLHILGGIFIGTLFVYLFFVRFRVLGTLSFFPKLILGLGFVALIGIGWEWYEIFVDVVILNHYTLFHAPGYLHFDTLKDLFDDLVGGTIAIFALQNVSRENR